MMWEKEPFPLGFSATYIHFQAALLLFLISLHYYNYPKTEAAIQGLFCASKVLLKNKTFLINIC